MTVYVCLFVFKQQTAYDVRISDWISDVCSSDLFTDPMADGPAIQASSLRALKAGQTMRKTLALVEAFRAGDADTPIVLLGYYNPIRSEERRVGKECVSTCRSRRSPYQYKKKQRYAVVSE